jgi:hypothetical protein
MLCVVVHQSVCVCVCVRCICRVVQNHIYTVHIRCFWWGNHQINIQSYTMYTYGSRQRYVYGKSERCSTLACGSLVRGSPWYNTYTTRCIGCACVRGKLEECTTLACKWLSHLQPNANGSHTHNPMQMDLTLAAQCKWLSRL